jgi:hypothetical protein
VVYATTQRNGTGQIAQAIAEGVQSQPSAVVRCLDVTDADYKRDVFQWANAVILGSPTINGNADPSLLQFINSFDIEDDLSGKIGSSFATGGAPAAGLQLVLEEINRGLMMFGMLVSGGGSWLNSEGSGIVVNGPDIDNATLGLATNHGRKIADLTFKIAGTKPVPSPSPSVGKPPSFGKEWTAIVAANMAQVVGSHSILTWTFLSCRLVSQHF